jgi:photosystem II stability/assembly factor-like uncharacterized protein
LSVTPEGPAAATELDAELLSGLELRGIGPALMGGRIADIAVDPGDRSRWYVAVGSGGVWKTENAGITWKPIFDGEISYSIGAVTLDPGNPDVVWVGTGENVSGRHVAWGDGVYKSLDGGQSWEAKGLEGSEHIGRILVDPRDTDVVFVAAEGPLWAPGGERGLYKTTDGGTTWTRSLFVDEDTGVTSVELDPRDPDVLYAATYQRRRTVWSFLAGGPGSGIHKSTDGGTTWARLERGLPKKDMGKIGLAVSPVDPDVVYATIEANEDERGFYRSLDRGASWEKRNAYVSGGTGPHYYQEIYASPHDVDRVYQMDVFLHVTNDGGANFAILGNGREKHSDNHALVIDPEDPEHLIAGTDGGIYETFDHGAKWRHTRNLPVAQFYKLGLDTSEPFYNIVGGAQDMGTLLGPSRTDSREGIRNQDWYVPLGADGYASVFDTELPNLLYIEWQGGRLYRYDRASEEALDIQPQPEPGDAPERFNWDAPVITSAHSTSRIYFGSQRLWRSDDRGDSWTALSGDLTGDPNRYELEVAGRVHSVDSLWDHGAMSWYGTLTTLAESPLDEALLYTGSDDGIIQVSENGGDDWRRAAPLPGVPERAFVNDLRASLHDADTVYAAVDNHKTGDYRPLLFKSRDRGRSWLSIAGDLEDGALAWAIVEDHVAPSLLFAATDRGLFFTPDGGARWIELTGGVPTISFRDVEIQRRENDLVGATFGRGFFVLDDYSALRDIAAGALEGAAALFPVRDAWWYVPLVPMQAPGKPGQGSTDFAAPNPPFGALFTYYIGEETQNARELRREEEERMGKEGADAPFPGWERLREEELEAPARIFLTVRDEAGTPVRRIEGANEAGIHRASWDLRRQPPDPVEIDPPGFRPPWAGERQGPLAAPGRYTVELTRLRDGVEEALAPPQSFAVKPVPESSLPIPDFAVVTAFQKETAELVRAIRSAAAELRRVEDKLPYLEATLAETPAADAALFARFDELRATAADLRLRLFGDPIRNRWDEPSTPSISRRAGQVAGGHWDTRQAPTATHRRNLEIAAQQLTVLETELADLVDTVLPAFERDLDAAGAPPRP